MNTDKAELLIHRTIGEWLKERTTVTLTINDYLSLVDLLTFVLSESEVPVPETNGRPIPHQNIVNPENGVFCEQCNGFYPKNHNWIKHRIRTNAKKTDAVPATKQSYIGKDDIPYQADTPRRSYIGTDGLEYEDNP